jgi:zinc transporter 1/2/3
MFVIILITGNIPLKSVSFNSNQKMMSLSTAFSGGLFIAVGIIHLMPEAVHKITHHFQRDEYSDTEVKPYA